MPATLILGLETSCDETAAAVVADGVIVRSNVVASQHDLHERYRGVVPEIASRAHLQNIQPVIEEALAQAGIGWNDLAAIAVGNRPGLVGSLIIGVSAAKTLAWSLQLPLIGVDHVQAHLHAASLRETRGESGSASSSSPPSPHGAYPALGLVVSGGHTSMYEVDGPLQMRLIGRTIDDAVGEAYDKAAVILQAGYPGGPKLDRLAQTGDPSAFDLPRSLLGPDSLDFSFSGLKTALLYAVRGHPRGRGRQATFERSAADLSETDRRNLAAAFQAAAIEVVILKLQRGLEAMRRAGREPRGLIVGGGVSANSLLRRRVAELGQAQGVPVHIPAMAYCLDNAAMIGGLAYHFLQQGRTDDLDLPVIATTSL